MPCIVVLTRRLVLPKQTWREHGRRRTLEPAGADALLRRLRELYKAGLPARGWAAAPLEQGSAASSGEMRDGQKARVAVFHFAFTGDGVKVALGEEGCLRRLGIPRRRTRQIVVLRPWKPVRVLLNGRSTDYSGQRYTIEAHHIVLCDGALPERLEPVRVVDLQADLM